MISSLTVKNFRGFQELWLENLRQINVIVGANGSGKTVLLEAVFLGTGGNPAIANLINLSRNLNQMIPGSLTQAQFNEVWKYLFTLGIPEEPIEISHRDSLGRKATVRIFYDRNAERAGLTETPQVGSDQRNVPLSTKQPGVIVPLAFERTEYNGLTTKLYAAVSERGQLLMPFAESLGPPTTLHVAPSGGPNEDLVVQWFSQISLQPEGRVRFLDLLRRVYPHISGLEVLSPLGPPKLFASLNGSKQLLPVTLISGESSKSWVLCRCFWPPVLAWS